MTLITCEIHLNQENTPKINSIFVILQPFLKVECKNVKVQSYFETVNIMCSIDLNVIIK